MFTLSKTHLYHRLVFPPDGLYQHCQAPYRYPWSISHLQDHLGYRLTPSFISLHQRRLAISPIRANIGRPHLEEHLNYLFVSSLSR